MFDLPVYPGGYAAAFPGAGRLGTAAAHISFTGTTNRLISRIRRPQFGT